MLNCNNMKLEHQAGIDTGSKTVNKEVLETQAQQKYYRKILEDDLKRKTEKELEQNKIS